MTDEPSPFVDFEDVRALTIKYSDELSEQTKTGIRVDLTVLADVHHTASVSIKFHNLKTINHYKQAAHVAFWFQKFKPLRFIEPTDIRTVLTNAMDNAITFIFGDEAKFASDFGGALKDYEAAKHRPINEWVAFFLAKNIIRSAQEKIAKENESVDVQNMLLKVIEETHRKFESAVEIDDIVHGIRYHNYSARGFATMIEGMFKVSGA